MSHTTEWEGIAYPEQSPKTPGPTKGRRKAIVTMHHNSDMSGNVRFSLPHWIADAELHHGTGLDGEDMVSVHIPYAAIHQLVMEHYRRLSIAALENADGKDLVNMVLDCILEDAEKEAQG